jgi:hypothetical protein
LKREEEKRAEENELRELKKQEREIRRLENEKRKQERQKQQELEQKTNSSLNKHDNLNNSQRQGSGAGVCGYLFSLFFMLLLISVLVYVILNNYCDKKNRSDFFSADVFKNEKLVLFFDVVEKNACPRMKEFNHVVKANFAIFKRYLE